MSNVAVSASCLLSEAKYSSWQSHDPISKLVEELSLHGPLLVKSKAGRQLFEEEPSVLSMKLENRSVYYWKPGSKKVTDQDSLYHIIVIVKADETLKRIYYLDPMDESYPENIQSQKVYTMSYERLKEHIQPLLGLYLISPGKVAFHIDKASEPFFAFHM